MRGSLLKVANLICPRAVRLASGSAKPTNAWSWHVELSLKTQGILLLNKAPPPCIAPVYYRGKMKSHRRSVAAVARRRAHGSTL